MSLPTGYLVAGPDGVYGGPFVEQDAALAEREALMAEGDECWLVPVFDRPVHHVAPTRAQAQETFDAATRFLTNRDPGDENDYQPREEVSC